jgi:pSer/pThr/pTyr-binding forkhead associated (FHA) protein
MDLGGLPVPPRPSLQVVVGGRRQTVHAAQRVVLGRGPLADVDISHPAVSRQHAILEPSPEGWTLTDCSRNGTFVDGRRVTQLAVAGATTVHLGQPPDSVVVEVVVEFVAAGADAAAVQARLSSQGRLSSVHQVRSDRMSIGRLPDNDVVLDDLLVSRRHAALRRTPAGWEVVDLTSGNGTFVNGQRVSTAPIGADDVIGIGRALLHVRDDVLETFLDAGDNSFEARDIGSPRARATRYCTPSASRSPDGRCSPSSDRAARRGLLSGRGGSAWTRPTVRRCVLRAPGRSRTSSGELDRRRRPGSRARSFGRRLCPRRRPDHRLRAVA